MSIEHEYSRLIQRVTRSLDGEKLDVVVPALTLFLAQAGAFSGKDKRGFITFVVERIDAAFDELERRSMN